MILTALFGFALRLVNWLVGLLPSFSGVDTTNAFAAVTDSRVWQYLAWLNWFFPVDVALVLFGLRLTIFAGLYVFEAVAWVVAKAPTMGGWSPS